MDFPAENIIMGQEFFDRILLADGLAHIAENIFDQIDGETLANCESVCELWRQFISNNGNCWKRQYLQKLAKPGTDARALIKSNPNLFQFDCQADQGTYHTFLTNLFLRLQTTICIVAGLNMALTTVMY
jgi:hypothetical protein